MALLKIENLKIKYNDNYLFTDLSFTIKEGDKLAVIGQSGSGKSSILKAIIGAIDYEGTITRCSDVCYMPQDLALLDFKTVRENVQLPRQLNNNPSNIEVERYKLFGLEDQIDKYVSNLSGGQRQRVALMRALNSNGKILLFDEPLSKLDEITKEGMIDYFSTHITKEYGLIYITHDLNEAIKIGTKILVIGKQSIIVENDEQMDKSQLKKILESRETNENIINE